MGPLDSHVTKQPPKFHTNSSPLENDDGTGRRSPALNLGAKFGLFSRGLLLLNFPGSKFVFVSSRYFLVGGFNPSDKY